MQVLGPESPDSFATPAPRNSELVWKVPEILAPAGGREQFFAALQAGADAVFLGLKNFNARGRAANFTHDDLRELLPLARARGMKVLVTLNILLKDAELPTLIEDLLQLQFTGVDAVIVQDLGVARLIREQFPSLRLHASTQMAVHNKAGVLAAAALGFKRVVLARELTAQEIRKIRREVPAELIEIEAFCHGSLCYSYSGLCFFSGAEDARSGNRGECAYTCRKPYKVLNEPGHGFLFSMKDLDTSLSLDKLVYAGVDTLKIEGRKKDAQYVATTVGLYRQQLNELFGRDTARGLTSPQRNFRQDMAFSFHRETTSLFVSGRYHENVIDLANPTHVGLKIGPIKAVRDGFIELETSEDLERFDGLRIQSPDSLYHALPQHGQKVKSTMKAASKKYENSLQQFSLRDFFIGSARVSSAKKGSEVRILLPSDMPAPRAGDFVYKIRSNELKRHTDEMAQAPVGSRLRPLGYFQLEIRLVPPADGSDLLRIEAHASLAASKLCSAVLDWPAERPRSSSRLPADLHEVFSIFGDLELEAELNIVTSDNDWFVPKSRLKELKHRLGLSLDIAIADFESARRESANAFVNAARRDLGRSQEAAGATSFQIKIDRLEYLPLLAAYRDQAKDFNWDELIFEPKRAFLGTQRPLETFTILRRFAEEHELKLRLALPTVIRAWDEPLLTLWIDAFTAQGGRAFELGNLGCFTLLKEQGLSLESLDLSGDFTLYGLNTEAILSLSELGLRRCALSVEDDALSLQDKLTRWPEAAGEPQLILYKDTPLFIAEACSLTALHQGCPTAKVCGYRTLEIANEENERFFVAHESCKSIVYGEEAFAWTQHRPALEKQGVRLFRADFLTRLYSADDLHRILSAIEAGSRLAGTQSANFSRELL